MAASVRYWDKTGASQITGEDWGYIAAGASSTPLKFFIENNGDRILNNIVLTITQVGVSDGYTMDLIGQDIVTVIPPYGVTAVGGAAGAGGIFSAIGLWYYRITATNASGETVGSTEVSVTLTATTQKVTLAWTAPAGATGYKIYRSQTSGSYTSPSLITTISSGATITFIDDGTAAGAGALPSDNTTYGAGPNYGTAPALGTAPLTIGNLAIGQQANFWMQIAVPSSASELGNQRTFRIVPSEN